MTSLLLFLSGFAGLVYQVLWMRDLAVLFGSSAHAAAITLAVFFAGLAGGAALFARVAPRVSKPLRLYGLLELGIAASALLFLLLLDVYGLAYAPLYQRFGDNTAMLVGIKSLLAVPVVGAPAVLMGATLPAMVQYAGHSAWLYGMNTAGAAAGAFFAGFYFPPVLGFRLSYIVAVALNVIAGAAALAMSPRAATRGAQSSPPRGRQKPPRAESEPLPARAVGVLAFASGALSIALEVTWLRMFAQVLDNSVYAFSAVLVVALIAFALASLAVARFQTNRRPAGSLAIILGVSGVITAGQAPLFIAFTNDLSSVSGESWGAYIARVFTLAALFVGLTGFVVGLVFPALLRLLNRGPDAGARVGRLLTLNTVGAISGSLLATFVVLSSLGVWQTAAAIAVAYSALAVWLARQPEARRQRPLAFAALALTVAALGVSTTLPRVRLDDERGERVLEIWEGSHGTVAVTETHNGRLLRLNNSYSLGGTTDRIERERIQSLIPLLLHPDPQRVFYLGLGTGITAGEALRHPVKRVVVCELVTEVVRASHAYFGQWTRGLTTDPRVDIRVEDGRHFLAATDESFDVIVSDLFVPWHAGTGMLYTVEHFEGVRERLRPGGLFAQWLPLFQLSQHDFEVIARTLLTVFPHVVIWRGDFYATRPIVALVASVEPMQLDASHLLARARGIAPGLAESTVLAGVMPFYVGNLARAGDLLRNGAINTDERPLIEYVSPRAQWSDSGGWFVSTALVRFYERLRAEVPLDNDPYLSALSPEQRQYVDSGRFYYRAIVARVRGDDGAAEPDLMEALQRLPSNVQVSGPFMGLEPLLQ